MQFDEIYWIKTFITCNKFYNMFCKMKNMNISDATDACTGCVILCFLILVSQIMFPSFL